MAKFRILKNPPITEAVIDFLVKPSQSFDIKQIEALKNELKDIYPKTEEMRQQKINIDIKAGGAVKSENDFIGYLVRSADEKNVAQFKRDGFTFSRLRPYTSWEKVYSEAKKLWGLYVSKTSPEMVTRIATRYINHFSVPAQAMAFKDYLEAPPVVPEGLPTTLSSFLTRIVIRDNENNLETNFIQALEPRGASPTFIIDIDVFENKQVRTDDQIVWERLTKFRGVKNNIFFKAITEKTAQLFE